MRRKGKATKHVSPMQALLLALSDDIALPLLQIRSSLETLQLENYSKQSLQSHASKMIASTEGGLHLVEAYRLALQSFNRNELEMKPVAISIVLQEVAHKLTPYAKEYSTDLEVDVQGRLTPVLAHYPSLSIALEVLSASLIRAQAAHTKQKRYRILLGAHRAPQNTISTGVFSNLHGLSDRALRSARILSGKARQPFPNVPTGAASGVLIADMLCTSMWQPLRAAAHSNMHGLATLVPISKQLQFV